MRLLAKDPADRPASARETADALRTVERQPAPEPIVLPTTVDGAPAPERTLAPTAAPVRRGRKTAIVAIVVGAGCVLLLASALLLPPVRTWLFPGAHEPDKPANNGPPNDAPHVPALWKGSINLEINNEGNPAHRFLRLNDRDELPLKPGDMVAVQTNLDHPGYCYAVWIEADGTVDPVYPWNPGNWEERPAEEQPVRRLRQPKEPDSWHTLEEGPAGMHTLLLLVRETPLPRDVDLRAELAGAAPQGTPWRKPQATAWFENGELIRHEGQLAADFDDGKNDDPVRLLQERIRSRLGPGEGKLFQYTRAVSFASRGK